METEIDYRSELEKFAHSVCVDANAFLDNGGCPIGALPSLYTLRDTAYMMRRLLDPILTGKAMRPQIDICPASVSDCDDPAIEYKPLRPKASGGRLPDAAKAVSPAFDFTCGAENVINRLLRDSNCPKELRQSLYAARAVAERLSEEAAFDIDAVPLRSDGKPQDYCPHCEIEWNAARDADEAAHSTH